MSASPTPAAWLRIALVVLTLSALAGCYMPSAQQHAQLHIAADGSYRFNGQPVGSAGLAAAIGAAKRPDADLVVQIDASSAADVAAVMRAVDAVKAAHGRVAFAGASS